MAIERSIYPMLSTSILGEGEPILLLHGLFGQARNLGGIARTLAQSYKVFLVDLPNHGSSYHYASDGNCTGDGVPVDGLPMTAEDLARRVMMSLRKNVEWQEAVAKSPARLLGHSLGGKVAMQMALLGELKLSHLLVVDIAPVNYPPHHTVILNALESLDLSTLSSRAEADRILAKDIVESGVRAFLLQSLAKDQQGFAWKFNLAAVLSHYHQVSKWPEGSKVDPSADFKTLFVRGENSDYIDDQSWLSCKGCFPNAELKMMTEAGHWLHAEKPAEFADIVTRFFET